MRVRQIATMCGCTYMDVEHVIIRDGFISKNTSRFKTYDEFQVDLICQTLFFELKARHFIFESKMNHVESKEEKYQQFREFKLKTYTR